MKTKDLNIFVCENVVCYDCRALPVRQLFEDACIVTYKWFDLLDIIYQKISGFILLINGPPSRMKLFSPQPLFLEPI